MRSAAGLENMNSISPELNWKSVTKRKRTRKAVARSFKGGSEGIVSPKRVADFSGSDSDKIAVKNPQQRKPGKSEQIPPKKRRRLPRSASPKPSSSLPASKGQDQFLDSNYSSFTKLQLEGIGELAKAKSGKRFTDATLTKQAEEEIYTGDFSGIELLAAAASMEDSSDNNADKVEHAVEDCSVRGSSHTSTVLTPAEVALKCNESGKSSSTSKPCEDSANGLPVLNKCNATSQSSSGAVNVAASPTCISSIVDRRFWDLNTDMDAWGVPADSAVLIEELKGSEDGKISNPGVIQVESSILKSEEIAGVTSDITSCTESTGLQGHVVKPVKNLDCSLGTETFNQAFENGIEKNHSSVVTCGDANMKIQDVKIPDAEVPAPQIVDTGKDAKDYQKCSESLGNATSLMNSIGYTTCKREYGDNYNVDSDEVNRITSVSTSENFLAAGTCIKDEKCVGVSDSMVQNDETFLAAPTKLESHSQQDEFLPKDKLVAKHEDNDLPNEESGKTMLEDSCNSYSARAQYGRHVTSAGKMDADARPESPYEDGELRLSCLEDNELEAECVDYESDGRKGEDSDAADDLGSDVVEGGCEVSRGTEGRISMMKRSVAGYRETSDLAKHPSRRNFSRDESKTVETCGKKESDGGSGTTVEQGLEMGVYENNDAGNRRGMTRQTHADAIKGVMHEYASRMGRAKLQSPVGGRSSLEAADGKFFSPQFRSRRMSGFHERDGSPEKYVGRYRPATFRNDRDGAYQWNNWGPKGRFNTTHHESGDDRNGPRPRRNFTGEVADKYDGLDFHEQRQPADYMSRGVDRRIVRTRSPADREAGFNTHKGELPTRRFNFRGTGRGHYQQNGSRDFGEDYEPRPNGGAAPARFSRMPRRDRSFSPDPVRDAHVPFTQRRSRSRSKSRSPRPWHSYRDNNYNRRPSGSPEFRSDSRVERVRAPFQKPNFASEYREGYISPNRTRFSPQRSSRWVDGPSFGENHFKRRRSPTGVFRGTNQSFSAVSPSGRVKSDKYFKPMIRPRRSSFMDSDGRENKFETTYDDRKLEDREEMRRGKPREDGGNFRRFQYDVINEIETNNSNNEEGVRRPAPVDLPQVQCDREDKKEFEI